MAVRTAVVALLLALAAGCAREVPGRARPDPVLAELARVTAGCPSAVADVTAQADALLAEADAEPGPPDVVPFYLEMRAVLSRACGGHDGAGEPTSAIVLHLAAGLPGRSPASRALALQMIRGMCGSITSPLETRGLRLTAAADRECARLA